MRHILQGFTQWIDGQDFGYDTGTVQLPVPTPLKQSYLGGGMALTVDLTMAAFEALECTVKMLGQNPDIMKKMAKGPGITSTVTYRAAVLDEPSGQYVPHLGIVQGCPNFADRDEWKRGEQSGFGYTMGGIIYYRYEVGPDIIHEVQAWPPKWVVDGVDQLAGINAALGY